jgi:hypothetical protein
MDISLLAVSDIGRSEVDCCIPHTDIRLPAQRWTHGEDLWHDEGFHSDTERTNKCSDEWDNVPKSYAGKPLRFPIQSVICSRIPRPISFLIGRRLVQFFMHFAPQTTLTYIHSYLLISLTNWSRDSVSMHRGVHVSGDGVV